MIKNLEDYKNQKKLKLVYLDLIQIQSKLTTCLSELDSLKRYIPVMEAISVLHNSRTIVEININKYKRMIDQK